METELIARYAVIGHPITHSRSPEIHAAFAVSTGRNIRYERIEGSLLGFEAEALRFFEEGGSGLNVTLPFKERALALTSRCTERALCAGAANTLGFGPEGIWADNTDGVGLVRDLVNNLGVELQGADVLILGAGGAARGVIQPLFEAGASALWVVNRTRARAERLVAELGVVCAAKSMQSVSWSDLSTLQGFNLILNATSSSVNGEWLGLPDNIFLKDSWAYDLGYGQSLTPFLQNAQQLGVTRLSDGLGMLVEQAAESFQAWHGVRPETRGVIGGLRSRITPSV